MKIRLLYTGLLRTLCHSLALVAVLCALSLESFAQTNTAAGTNINNTASATYSDGTNSYSTVSNQVTVTVAKVAGLTITPDGQTNPTVVAGQTNVPFTFRVTNVGNFSDQVKFLASGASIRVTGPATVASAVIVGPGTDIATNASAVTSAAIAQNGYIDVTVNVNINASAAAGSAIQVFLGDSTTGTNFDNVAADSSAHEVDTVSTGAVNGSREARGDISTTVDNDGQAQANLTVPAGPVALGSNITYAMQVCNTGQRTLNPIGTDTSIYEEMPIPVGTTLISQTFPTGTQFTTDPLTTLPTAATWSNTFTASATRIRVPVAASLAAGVCSSTFSFAVQVTTNNANTPIYAIADTFAKNSIGATVTDQSGDTVSNKGDSNANFSEPLQGGTVSPTQGFQQPTLLQKTGSVLIGPSGAPAATGPTSNNDDYTNKAVNTGIAGVAPGGVTTAAGTTTFTNSIQNTGNANDTYTLTAPTVPAGFTVQISTDGGTTYTTVSGGGSTTISVPFGTTGSFLTKVTEPAGKTVLTGYDTIIHAVSGIDSTKSNDTIDRLYTGFIRLDKTAVVNNTTGVGAATDAVPGADITYTITYTNISSTGGSGSVGLTATNVVVTEDGNAAPNNWGGNTTQNVGSGKDYTGTTGTTAGTGTIAGDTAASTLLTDTVPSVAPGVAGRFVFARKIK